MAYIINLTTFSDDRGSLSVVEKILPFEIKRVYFIYDVLGERGGHKHKKTTQALIMLNGSCEVFVRNRNEDKRFVLDASSKCLILEPDDWHTMDFFTDNSTLLVLASEYYDKNDYIWEIN
jgi:hypothetical protein